MKRKAIKVATVLLASIFMLSSCSTAPLESAATAETSSIKITSAGTNETTEIAAITMKETTVAFADVTIFSAAVTYADAPITPAASMTSASSTAAKEITIAPSATTKALDVITKVTATATAASPAETSPAQTVAPAYAENCENIKNLIIAQLQAKGLWYPDADVIGGGSIQLSVGYANADEQYATAFVNGKFGTPDGTGATSISVWIADGYLNISYIKCTLPIV